MNKKEWEARYKALKERGTVGSMSWNINDKVIRFQEEIKPYINKLGNKFNTVIDFGCGTGKNTEFLMSLFKCKKYIGYDIVKLVIDENKKRFPGEFKVFDDEIVKADIIWSSFCLQHMTRFDFEDTLDMFKKALNKDGRIYIINSLVYYAEKDYIDMFKKLKLKGEMVYKTQDNIAVYEVKK